MKIHADMVVLIVTSIVSLLFARRQEKRYLRHFPLFLFVTSIVEIIGLWIASYHRNNTLLYNIYTVFQFSSYLYFFTLVLEKKYIRTVNLARVTLALFGVIDLLLIQGATIFNTYFYAAGCLSVDIFAVIYFIGIFKRSEKIALTREPSFWIVTGLAFHCISSMSYLGILNYVSSLPSNVSAQLVNLLVMGNVLLYILFIIALLCRLNSRRSISNT